MNSVGNIFYNLFWFLFVITMILVFPLFLGFALIIGGAIVLEKLEVENTFVYAVTVIIMLFISFKIAIWWDSVIR